MNNNFNGQLKLLIDKALNGSEIDVDFIMGKLTSETSFAMTRYLDFALSMVRKSEGIKRINFSLFNGTLIQRNYASLFINQLGEWETVKEAYEQGLMHEIQAFAR